MSATNFSTKNETFRKLIGNGLVYRIPRFQRDYSWTETEWEDLWLDIRGITLDEVETAHYMGYLVLQSENDKEFDVIDGQQRLTTLSIVILAVLKNYQRLIDTNTEPTENKKRLEQFQQTYIGYLDPVTLVPRPKLTLNRNNNDYYSTYLVPLGHLPSRGFRSSEHSLRKAFVWFDRRIQEQIVGDNQSTGTLLAQFVESLADRLFFTVITVTDELNAYKVFETLNARGVRLSATDLLKNYLFSVLHSSGQGEHEMKSLENRWEAIVGRLGSESFPDFLRAHWNSRHSFLRQAELFKRIRSKIDSAESVFQLLRELEEDVDSYSAITSPDPSDWPNKQKTLLKNLRLFSVRQPFPLLMAAKRKLSNDDFENLLKAVSNFSFRYHVIGSQLPSEIERLYNHIAEKVSNDEIKDARSAIIGFKKLYPTDSVFREWFSSKSLRTSQNRNKRIVRYILCKLEQSLTQTTLDFDSDTFGLEHVLPQNPESGWEQFSNDESEELTYRLGNMTLLKNSSNRALANLSYKDKRRTYTESSFLITRKLGDENAEWNAERMANRQRWMAKQAISIWSIGTLTD
jgi:hypothetical protein